MLPSGRLGWSLAVPLLALAGLFAMHGLSDHHTGGQTGESGHHAMSLAPAGMLPADLPALVPSGGLGQATAAIVCFGVLLGAALALTLSRRAPRRTSWTAPRVAWLTWPAPHARDPDPPSRALLSVCRC